MSFELSFTQSSTSKVFRSSARFRYDNRDFELWFEIPLDQQKYLSSNADAFVLGLIFPAMETGNDLVIKERKVSKGLLKNIHLFQQKWNEWRPEKYSLINIEAEEAESNTLPKDSICAFSGGLDSSFLLHSEQDTIGKALYVHGIHAPVGETDIANKNFNRLRKISDSLDIELLRIDTNIRAFGNWHDIHGAAIASCLSLFNEHFSEGRIASSHPYQYLRLPWGSNPVSDPLLSSNGFHIKNTGGNYPRIEKMKHLKGWKVCTDHLMVCTREFDHNCGRCEKCIRTKLNYSTFQINPDPAFKYPGLTAWDVVSIKAYLPWEIKDYEYLKMKIKENDPNTPILPYLSVSIFLNRILLKISRIPGLSRFFSKSNSKDIKNRLYQYKSEN